MSLVGLRLIVAIPIFSALWLIKQDRADSEWKTYTLIAAGLLCFLALIIHAVQVVQLFFIRIVMEPEGITIYRKKLRHNQVMQFGWSELDLPTKVVRYKWMRWLGCLMGFTHILHLLLPEPLSEIRLKSVESGKQFQFASTPSFNDEHAMLAQIGGNALSFWLDRRLVTVDPEHQPSKENRWLRLQVGRRYLYAYSEEEYKNYLVEILVVRHDAPESVIQEQLAAETEGERVLRTMDPKAEVEQEVSYCGFGEPYGENGFLCVEW